MPPKASVETVEVNIDRNLQCPSWRQGDQNKEILETTDLATEIARVEAEDRDAEVDQAHSHCLTVYISIRDHSFLYIRCLFMFSESIQSSAVFYNW